jgi:hypothetical protein
MDDVREVPPARLFRPERKVVIAVGPDVQVVVCEIAGQRPRMDGWLGHQAQEAGRRSGFGIIASVTW